MNIIALRDLFEKKALCNNRPKFAVQKNAVYPKKKSYVPQVFDKEVNHPKCKSSIYKGTPPHR